MMRWVQSTRSALKRASERAIALVPIGATEQHGPHLPTGTDTFHTEDVVWRAANVLSGSVPVVVAPALPFGSSEHHVPFGATISLSSAVFYGVVRDVCESIIRSGFSRIFLVNGHGGNHELVVQAARDVAVKHQVHIGTGSWWAVAKDAMASTAKSDSGRIPGHAGRFETALILAIRPELVQMTRVQQRRHVEDSRPSAYRLESHGFWRAIDGYPDGPRQATRDDGAAFLQIAGIKLSDAVRDFHSRTKSPGNRRNRRSESPTESLP